MPLERWLQRCAAPWPVAGTGDHGPGQYPGVGDPRQVAQAIRAESHATAMPAAPEWDES